MNYLYDLWDDFISLLFPRLCYACGSQLLRNEYLICTGCYVSIPRTNFHLKAENPVAQLFWGRCMIQKAAAFSFYTRGSRIRNLIHKLKYSGIKEIGCELGRIYAVSLKSSGFTADIDIIIPVPLHPARKRIRGFNQSECISAGISDVTGLPLITDYLPLRQTGPGTSDGLMLKGYSGLLIKRLSGAGIFYWLTTLSRPALRLKPVYMNFLKLKTLK
jgi:predicted amidophosphoribosyltransferase